MARVLLVVVIMLALLLALFGVQNPQTVDIRFLNIRSGYVPVYVVILLSTLAGIVLSAILGLRSRIGATLKIRKLERQVADLQQQIAARTPVTTTSAPVTSNTSSTSTSRLS